jgi:hypothetical protein
MPNVVFKNYIEPTLNSLPNLTLLTRSVVKNIKVDGTNNIQSVTIVSRTPVSNSDEWSWLFSEEVNDWYSTTSSLHYNKEVIEIFADVFIEATEFGDVLALLSPVTGIDVTTGVEIPDELSTESNSNCG